VTVSIGVAAACPDDRVVEDIVRRADAALYDAKRAGKDRVAQATADAPSEVAVDRGAVDPHAPIQRRRGRRVAGTARPRQGFA